MRSIYLLSLLLVGTGSFGQSINFGFAFPSSNNSFLGKVSSGASVGVDRYTGTAAASVPICTIPSKDLKIPISVDYVDGRGVKVHEYASQVGLGWQLNAGGSITRVVRGFPDEQPNGYLGTGTLPSGLLSPGQQWGKVVSTWIQTGIQPPNNQTYALGFGGVATADGQPDLFNVKTPFFNFQFELDANGSPVFPNSSGYKIITNNFINTTNYANSSFEVIDDQGNQFFFGSSPASIEQCTDSLYNVPTTFISTWYLDHIITFNDKEVITLNYQAASANVTHYDYIWSEVANLSTSTTTIATGQNIILAPKFVSSIVTSQGEADFGYLWSGRGDDPNAPELTTITTKAYNPATQSNSTTLQTYTFNYAYFGVNSTDPNVLRLQLVNITVAGNTSATSTPINFATFGYNTTNNLPNRTWPIADYWGYCNSTTNPGSMPISGINMSPNLAMAQADILTSITTMTGATTTIYYQLNDYYFENVNTTVGGLRVSELAETLPTGEDMTRSYTYYSPNTTNSSGEIYSSYYNQTTFIFNSGSNATNLYISSSPFLSQDVIGNFVGYSWVTETDPHGGTTVYNFTNFNDNLTDADGFKYNDILNTSWQGNTFPLVLSTVNLSYKRGLPLSKAVYATGGTYPLSQTTYNYAAQTEPTAGIDAYGYQSLQLNGWLGNLGGSYSPSSTFYTPTENYRLVKTVQQDYQANTNTSVSNTTNYTYDPIATDPVNTYRLINTITSTDSRGSSYTNTQTIYYPEDLVNGIPMVTSSESTAISAMISRYKTGPIVHAVDNRNGTNNVVHNSYAQVSNGNIYLATVSGYASDPVNTTPTLTKQQSFVYDPVSSNPISSSLIGDGAASEWYGYNLTVPIAKVVDASSSNSPSVTNGTNSVTLSNGTNTTQQNINFTVGGIGNIQVQLSWPTLPAQGTNNTASVNYTITGPEGFPPIGNQSICISSNNSCSAYTNTIYAYFYCVPGNYVLTITSTQNPENNLSQFQIVYPSTVTNAFTNEFFYEGFEQIGNVSTSAHTGNLSYSGSYSVPYTLPNGRSYLIQWWDYSGGAWVFNQQAYTGPTTLTGQIDDVRVFPKDALMTTYTYSPLVGKTSETDPAGRSTIYQYDGLNRIQTIRDQDNNILKQFDYEYQQCVTPVYNAAQSWIYVRNNCSTGLYGSAVTYTVPASKYSACTTVGVNQLVTNDLNYNGQNYANANGTCTSTPPCVPPTTVTAVASGNVITVSWNYPPGVGTNAYAVDVYNSAGTDVYDDHGTPSPLTINSSAIAYNTTYTVKVTSLCGSGAVGNPVSVTTGSSGGSGGTAQTVNLSNASSIPSGFCCFGCQYTTTVYSSTATIGAGTTLWVNSAMTQPITGEVWVFPYSNNSGNHIYQLSGNTVTPQQYTCP